MGGCLISLGEVAREHMGGKRIEWRLDIQCSDWCGERGERGELGVGQNGLGGRVVRVLIMYVGAAALAVNMMCVVQEANTQATSWCVESVSVSVCRCVSVSMC